MGPGTLTRIPSGSRVALDTVTFIYFLERHPVFYDSAKNLFERIEKGMIEAVASTLVLTELLVPAFRDHLSSSAQNVFGLLTHFPHLELIDVNARIAYDASRLRAESSLRTPDALHLATALAQHADWFVTNDRALTKLRNLPLNIGLFSHA
ncbi:MAG: type II toxin-antitoxin system VapC family toxin [Nitrospirales bacterium]|nr:type II toxin-antitoxin system VapC family toxin [Nitrospira sp.]MDR4500867.1 type II toxin-antitoxin system VapC family toxin [Nitrospirales bacterium]